MGFLPRRAAESLSLDLQTRHSDSRKPLTLRGALRGLPAEGLGRDYRLGRRGRRSPKITKHAAQQAELHAATGGFSTYGTAQEAHETPTQCDDILNNVMNIIRRLSQNLMHY